MPKDFKELKKILQTLETFYKDMQDVEFTVENNKLWMLQTRSGKRTSKSAVKIAVDLVKEKLISKKEAILRINPDSLDSLLHPTLDETSEINIIAKGLPASPGAASGKVVFESNEAERLNATMQDTILVRIETSPEDINGMHAANGILTAKCGNTESPCALDIQIKRGKWMLLPKAAELSRTEIERTKSEIIDLKLDLLFGLRTEEQIATDFDNEKRDYKSLVKQLDTIEGVIESENKISIAGPTKAEESVRRISIDEYINIKKRIIIRV